MSLLSPRLPPLRPPTLSVVALSDSFSRVRRICGGLLDHINFFGGFVYAPEHYRSVKKSEYRLQLLASLAAFVLAAVLISQGLQEAANRPISTPTVQSVASPAEVAALFDRQATGDGSVTGLVCPCSRAATPLSAGTSWSLPEDPFCRIMRSYTDVANFSSTSRFEEAATSALNLRCIPDEARPAFAAQALRMIQNGTLFKDPEAEDPFGTSTNAEVFASALEASLCALAFGLSPLSEEYFFVEASVPSGASVANDCSSNVLRNFAPSVFQFTLDKKNAIQMQQSRMLAYIGETINLCNTLLQLRLGFLRSMEAALQETPIALRPEDYRAIAERLFNTSLAIAGAQASAFVPGFAPDAYAAFTGPINYNFFTKPGFDLLTGNLFFYQTPLPLGTCSFSSRLPFVRADYFYGGLRYYYLTTRTTLEPLLDGRIIPIMAGEARVRITAPPLSYPYLQSQGRLFGGLPSDYDRITPGFLPGVSQNWVPVGDDLLTLLDACTLGLPISVDVHNLRPLDVKNLGGSFYPLESLNISSSNPNRCSIGAERAVPYPRDASDDVQPVLFNVPLSCPPLLQLLGKARSSSSYANASSSLRFSVLDYLAAVGNRSALAELEAILKQGDSLQRADVLTSSLFSAPLTFQHSVAGHYAACAPVSCSFIAIADPTPEALFVVGTGIFGGTSTTVVSLLGILVYWFSVCSYLSNHLREPDLYPLRWTAPPPGTESEGKLAPAEGEGTGRAGAESEAVVMESNPLSPAPIHSWPSSR